MQHAFYQEITQLWHQYMSLRKITQCDGQRSDMIMMTMRNGNCIHLLVFYQVITRQTITALSFRMHPCVHQDPMSLDIDKPSRRTNPAIRVQVGYPHDG